VLRALLAAAAVLWFTILGWIGGTLALVPLMWRRAPLGRRLHPRQPREARIIPFQPRRHAIPR
jgi:hypothetical protein